MGPSRTVQLAHAILRRALSDALPDVLAEVKTGAANRMDAFLRSLAD